jgi:hypothetical protein
VLGCPATGFKSVDASPRKIIRLAHRSRQFYLFDAHVHNHVKLATHLYQVAREYGFMVAPVIERNAKWLILAVDIEPDLAYRDQVLEFGFPDKVIDCNKRLSAQPAFLHIMGHLAKVNPYFHFVKSTRPFL